MQQWSEYYVYGYTFDIFFSIEVLHQAFYPYNGNVMQTLVVDRFHFATPL